MRGARAPARDGCLRVVGSTTNGWRRHPHPTPLRGATFPARGKDFYCKTPRPMPFTSVTPVSAMLIESSPAMISIARLTPGPPPAARA